MNTEKYEKKYASRMLIEIKDARNRPAHSAHRLQIQHPHQMIFDIKELSENLPICSVGCQMHCRHVS